MNKAAIRKTITRHEWLCQHVSPMPWQKDEPAFSYSIGFYETFAQPEVLIMGYPDELAYQFLHSCLLLIKEGIALTPDTRFDNILRNGYQAVFKPISNELYEEYLGIGVTYYGHKNFPAYVLFLPDVNNQFPWQPGYAGSSQERQLRLV